MQVRLTSKQRIQIQSGKDIWIVMNGILSRYGKIRERQEYFWVVGLMNNNEIDFIELLNIGSVNSVHIAPRELFRIAVIKNTPRVILVHNHPSGNVKPSNADKQLTDRMTRSGELIGVEILDHIIITTKTYFSFAEKHML